MSSPGGSFLAEPELFQVKMSRNMSKTDFWDEKQKELLVEKVGEFLRSREETKTTAKGPVQRKAVIGKTLWTLLKMGVFIASTTCFFYQSAQFYIYYYTYPTVIDLDVIDQRHNFKAPAITYCFDIHMFLSVYCSTLPHLCGKPFNYTAFCASRPAYCMKYIKFPENFNDTLYYVYQKVMMRRGFKHELRHIQELEENDLKEESFVRTHVQDNKFKAYQECFSRNFRGFSTHEELRRYSRNESNYQMGRLKDDIFSIVLSSEGEIAGNGMKPIMKTNVFYSVHSPLKSVNPMENGNKMERGLWNIVKVRLEEEHLLPHPYKTDCVDYNELWKKNNKSGPRSQELCRDQCHGDFHMKCRGCAFDMKMYPRSIDVVCPFTGADVCYNNKTLTKEKEKCLSNCKQECEILKYDFHIVQRNIDIRGSKQEILELAEANDVIPFAVYLQSSEVTVMSHTPLYTSEDLFSNIGGLMGCWLGISVWAFMDIFETACLALIQLPKMFKKSSKKSLKDFISLKLHSY